MKVNQPPSRLKGCLPFASLLGKLFGEEAPPVATNYSGVNFYALILRWTQLGDDAFEDILRTLGEKVDEAHGRITTASTSSNADYEEVVVEDETATVESLIGLSFVLSQAQIERVVSGVMRLHDRAKGETPAVTLMTTHGSKASIVKSNGSGGNADDLSHVEAIDAFANYYKHHTAWRFINWSKPDKFSKKTVAAIQKAGATSGSTKNFRTGFEFITGHNRYSELVQLSKIIKDWEAAMLADYGKELRKLNLLSSPLGRLAIR